MINQYRSVYIKPSNGYVGKGIYRVTIDNQKRINLIDPKKIVTVINRKTKFKTLMKEWRKNILSKRQLYRSIQIRTLIFESMFKKMD